MQYFILPLLLSIYFEILGQSILDILKIKKSPFNFAVGYAFIIASCYLTTSLLSALNCSFYLILVIYLIIFLISLYLIVKNIKNFKIYFNIYHIILMFISLSVLMYFTLNTTLGEFNGFDSTHYLNMVAGNIGSNALNSKNVVFGDNSINLSLQYTFQSFYYFASVILYVTKVVFNFLSIEFYYAQGYIWCFQILFYLTFISLLINSLEKLFKGKYLAQIALISLFVFGYGKLYFNSAFGFYGNTIRTIFVSYSIYYLLEYFNTKEINCKNVFTIFMLAACGSSSTAVFMILFLYFSLFFIEIDNNEKLFKEYSIVLAMPMVNLLSVLLDIKIAVILTILFVIVMFVFNDFLLKIIRKYNIKFPLLILCVLIMILLSYSVTHDIFNFDAFFNNGSEVYDMTLDYFDLSIGYNITKIYKITSLVTLSLYFLLTFKEKYAKIIIILILVFFNPFSCSFLNQVNVVYYRAYELILNPFTIILFTYTILSKFNYKTVYYCCFLGVFLLMVNTGEIKKPLYWHESFIPGNDYNPIYKITNEELNIIREINSLIYYEKIEEPKIVTPNLITQSMIPNGIYTYGREYQINPRWTGSEKSIYDIFWPVLHYGDARQPNNPDYNNMCKYIKDATIDFIVQPKSTEYYDEEQNIWYSLIYKIDECGSYAFYETENYSVYNFER